MRCPRGLATNSDPSLRAVHIPLLRCVTSFLCSSLLTSCSGYLIASCIFILPARPPLPQPPSPRAQLQNHLPTMSALGTNGPNGSLHTLMMRSSTPGTPRVLALRLSAIRSLRRQSKRPTRRVRFASLLLTSRSPSSPPSPLSSAPLPPWHGDHAARGRGRQHRRL